MTRTVTRARVRARAAILAREQRRDPRRQPWATTSSDGTASYARVCNICGWHGEVFEGRVHCEFAVCPACGSIARDRFLYHCWLHTAPYDPRARVLETSPRLGRSYRERMAALVRYVAVDFDQSLHRADLALDLQRLGIASDSIDVVLSAHVLEHVPETDAALAELLRVLRPGGHLFLQVPLLQGRTAPPVTPEFHGDDTPVYWRFGLDLTDRLRDVGFETRVQVTDDFRDLLTGRVPPKQVKQWDLPSIVEAAQPGDVDSVASVGVATRFGFQPSHMFATWACRKPDQAGGVR